MFFYCTTLYVQNVNYDVGVSTTPTSFYQPNHLNTRCMAESLTTTDCILIGLIGQRYIYIYLFAVL